jgi:hypothetical protein
MEQQSPFSLVTQLHNGLRRQLADVDVLSLPATQRRLAELLKRQSADARLDVRDYELSETREEQLKNAKAAKDRLDQLRKNILEMSNFGLFSAVDVAGLSGLIDSIAEHMR